MSPCHTHSPSFSSFCFVLFCLFVFFLFSPHHTCLFFLVIFPFGASVGKGVLIFGCILSLVGDFMLLDFDCQWYLLPLLWMFKVFTTCKLFSSFPLSSFLLLCFLSFFSPYFFFFPHLDECVSVVGMGLEFWLSSLTSHKWYSCSFDFLCFNFATRMWIFSVVCVITIFWQSRLWGLKIWITLFSLSRISLMTLVLGVMKSWNLKTCQITWHVRQLWLRSPTSSLRKKVYLNKTTLILTNFG